MENLTLFDFEPGKRTSWKRLFEEIEPYLMIDEWIGLIRPFYHTTGEGRPPKDLEVMLRVLLIQTFCSLSDEATEDLVYENITVRRFVGISINESDIPDSTTICRFRKLLTENDLTKAIFESVLKNLKKDGKEVKRGSLIDSTIIDSSKSKRNRDNAPDSESGWTKKGGSYRHGFKAHIAADAVTGVVTNVITTAANVHDATVANSLLEGDEAAVIGDSGYLKIEERENAIEREKYHIMKRPSSIDKASPEERGKTKARQAILASVRAKVEHCFGAMKHIMRFRYTRYRGLKKNAAKNYLVFALVNIWTVSRPRFSKIG